MYISNQPPLVIFEAFNNHNSVPLSTNHYTQSRSLESLVFQQSEMIDQMRNNIFLLEQVISGNITLEEKRNILDMLNSNDVESQNLSREIINNLKNGIILQGTNS